MTTTTIQERRMGVPLAAVAIICGLAFAAGAWAHYLTTPAPAPAPAPQIAANQAPISLGDVRDVIAALNTLAMPQKYDFDPPVTVTVQGDGLVRVRLKTKREVEFKAQGRDLQGAIGDLSTQAREVANLNLAR